MKGIRKIMKLKSTFVNRNNTFKNTLNKANQIKNPKQIEGKNIKLFSEHVLTMQNKLFAHTVRLDNTDPLRQATFIQDSITPTVTENRRVGRPRDNWTWNCMERLAVRNAIAVDSKHFWDNREHCIGPIERLCKNRQIKTNM